MPELPEVEALRRALDRPVSAFPVEKAGPAHIATLKTFEPPLAALDGRRFSGAERRAKRLLFPTDDGELVLMVHLMSAGRLRYLAPGEKGPKTPAFRLRFQGDAELAHLGPEALWLSAYEVGEICAAESRRLHSLLRDQRAFAGIGRAWANEILHAARLSPFALSRDLDGEEVERLATAIDGELSRGLELRE